MHQDARFRRHVTARTSKQHERYLRLFFEVHGLALQKPARYGRYLEGAVTSWVEMMATVLPAGLSLPRRRAFATLAVSSVVGLFLDYLSSGDLTRHFVRQQQNSAHKGVYS